MLKKDPKASFKFRTRGIFKVRKVYIFYFGKLKTVREWEETEYLELLEHQRVVPQPIAVDSVNRRQYWMFLDEFYLEDEGHDWEAVRALVLDKIAKQQKQVKRALARLDIAQK